MDDEAGYRELPHTADEIVEAWGPTRAACLAQAVAGFVATFAQVGGVPPTRRRSVTVAGTADDLLLVDLLDEVIYLLNVHGEVPVDLNVEEPPAGGLVGQVATAPLSAVTTTGPAPKGIAHSGLWIGIQEGRWRCRFTVDV